MSERKIILYIASSLDGFIAKPGDDLSFLDLAQKEGEDYGYFDFIDTIDTVIMGRRTYDWVMTQVSEFPHSDLESYIITSQVKPAQGNIQFYNGELPALVRQLKSKSGENVFVDGGAEIANALIKNNLIDEYIISVIPIILGSGVRLFHEQNPEVGVELISSKSFVTGLVQLHYKKKSDVK